MEQLNLPVRLVKKKQYFYLFSLFRLRVLSSGIKSFELAHRNEKKDLEEITSFVSILINYISFYFY